MACKKVAIGIDLGTTNSCVAVVRNGRVEIIANDQGNRITPSVVAFNELERLIGDSAKAQAAFNPENSVYEVKRLIGRRFDDPAAQKNMKHWPFKVQNVENNPKIQVVFKGETKLYSPEEISSMVLINMKETAESYIGSLVTDAVITVPAYFTDSQRQATIDAGKIAGLNVLSIINEPTAAAIAYGIDKQVQEKRNILIFDLGGGTFDVVILSIENGTFEVKAVNGDTFLGGADFDNLMVGHFMKEFKKKHKLDVSTNTRAMGKLRRACERAKRNLSVSLKERIQIDSLCNGIDFDFTISRVRFEQLCSKLFESTLIPVQSVLQDAGLDKEQIDEVVLAGGSTRIPKIQELLQQYFQGKSLNKTINPDEAVAYGAAIHAAVLTRDNTVKEVLLLDVCPLSLGVKVVGGYRSTIIKRNTKIPTTVSKNYTTVDDYQSKIRFKVYEGERSMCAHNHLLGRFTLKNIERGIKGTPSIKVTFAIDKNGILTASACDRKTGSKNSIVITSNKGRLNKKEISQMKVQAKRDQEEDANVRERTLARTKLEKLCFTTRLDVQDKHTDGRLANTGFRTVSKECESLIDWLDYGDRSNTKEDYEQALLKLQRLVIDTTQ